MPKPLKNNTSAPGKSDAKKVRSSKKEPLLTQIMKGLDDVAKIRSGAIQEQSLNDLLNAK